MRALLFTAFTAVFVYAQPDDSTWFRFNSEGIRLTKVPNYPVAETRFRSALAEAEAFGEQDYRYWATLSNLALVRQEQGDLASAEKLYRQVVDLRQLYLGRDRPEVASAQINLATVLHTGGRETEAEQLLRRALPAAEAAGDQKATAAALNCLALVLVEMGERARAEPVLRRAQALFEHEFGAESIEVAKATNNLAMLYRLEGEYARAEAMMHRALPVYEKVLGPNHPLFAGVLNNMFTVLGEQKRYDDGEPYLRRALEIGEKAFPETARLAMMRANLASLEAGRGHYDIAAKILESVITLQEKTLGPNHPQLATSLENYSVVLRQLHQKTEAKRSENRANAILKSLR